MRPHTLIVRSSEALAKVLVSLVRVRVRVRVRARVRVRVGVMMRKASSVPG